MVEPLKRDGDPACSPAPGHADARSFLAGALMTPDERRDLIRRANEEMWNEGNLEVCDEVFAENCSFHDPSFEVNGVAGMKEQVRGLRAAQPDLHMQSHEILIDGDLSAGRFTMGGTASGGFRGLPATGKSYVMTGMTISKWHEDRIVEQWVNYDLLGALQQVGIIPTPAQQPSAG
jgi:steroid delta-isomerase-like uncharacterized protein